MTLLRYHGRCIFMKNAKNLFFAVQTEKTEKNHFYTTVYDRSHVALIAQLGEHCTGIAEVVGSNPAQSLNFFQVSVLVVFNGRTCINYRYHSIATMGQITLIFKKNGEKNLFYFLRQREKLYLNLIKPLTAR